MNNSWIKEEHILELKEMCYEYLFKENFQIQRLALKLLTKVLRYATSFHIRVDILSHMMNSFLNSESFYQRRLYFYFFDELLNFFSMNYLKENMVLDNLNVLFNDTSAINKSILIKTLEKFYDLLKDDNVLKNTILTKINENRSSKDSEVTMAIRNFDKFIKRKKDSSSNSEQNIQNGLKLGEEIQLDQKISNRELGVIDKSQKKSNEKNIAKTTVTRLYVLLYYFNLKMKGDERKIDERKISKLQNGKTEVKDLLIT